MIRHIVMWKFKDFAEGQSREENIGTVCDRLTALVGVIPEICSLSLHKDVSHTDASMDLMLDTTFRSLADLKIYAEHPEHVKVSKFVRTVVDSRVVLDSEEEMA